MKDLITSCFSGPVTRPGASSLKCILAAASRDQPANLSGRSLEHIPTGGNPPIDGLLTVQQVADWQVSQRMIPSA